MHMENQEWITPKFVFYISVVFRKVVFCCSIVLLILAENIFCMQHVCMQRTPFLQSTSGQLLLFHKSLSLDKFKKIVWMWCFWIEQYEIPVNCLQTVMVKINLTKRPLHFFHFSWVTVKSGCSMNFIILILLKVLFFLGTSDLTNS